MIPLSAITNSNNNLLLKVPLSSKDKNINPTGSKSNLGRDVQLGLDPKANIKNRENSEESSKEKGALDDI